MITDEDTTKIVNRIIEVNKQLFYDKPEMDGKFEGLRKDFSTLQTAVTNFASDTKKNSDEVLVINQRASNQESWIKQVGGKIGLEYKP